MNLLLDLLHDLPHPFPELQQLVQQYCQRQISQLVSLPFPKTLSLKTVLHLSPFGLEDPWEVLHSHKGREHSGEHLDMALGEDKHFDIQVVVVVGHKVDMGQILVLLLACLRKEEGRAGY